MSPAWRFYIGLYSGWSGMAAAATGLVVTQAALTLPIAFLLKRLFDDAVAFSNPSRIAIFAAAIIALYLLSDALLLGATHLNLRITKSVVFRMRKLVIDVIYRLPALHSAEDEAGRIHAALVHDTERVDVMSNSLLSRIVPSLFAGIPLLIILLVLSWKLFLVVILLVPAAWVVTRLFRRPLQRSINGFRDAFDNFSNDTFSIVQRRHFAKIHCAEPADISILAARSEALRDASHWYAWMGTAAGIMQGEMVAITGIIALLVGGALIASGTMTLGTLMSFYFTLNLFRSNLSTFFANLPSVMAGNTALERLFLLLNRQETVIYGGEGPIRFRGDIRMEDVGFSYGETRIVTGVTMTIRAGEMAALGGPSGSGKTTLAYLILGLARPTQGRLLADGMPYDTLRLDGLRAGIGYAIQDPVILSATLRDNLVFGADAGEHDLHVAIKIAGATDFVSRFPDGLDVWLGENGAQLSGGERQRLSIARAILRRPALLVLDEPTNHLGTAEVLAILARFRAAYPASSILVISHDPQILGAASRLYMIAEKTVRRMSGAETTSLLY